MSCDFAAFLASVLYISISLTWELDGRVTQGWPVAVVAWAAEYFDLDANEGLTELEARLWCISRGLDPETWHAWS